MKITVRVLNETDLTKAQNFLFEMVEVLFQKERNPVMHRDIFEMSSFYFNTPKHVLIGAFDEEGNLVGTIGLKTFVDRFESFKGRYSVNTAEVGRCYIKQDMRRRGVGTMLLSEALIQAKALGYKMLYLHTHYHLPGGYSFWLKSSFKVFCIETINIDTIHMELPIE